MSRPLRLIVPGMALHVIQRGNKRTACFGADGDYLTYLGYLRHLSSKYRCELHAYCLMTNHVHLLMTPSTARGCALLMRDLGRCYARYFNRRYARTGTLWEGRFRSCIAESANYVLACYRYIELNPVRARMADHPGAYLWSSYASNAGLRSDPLIRPHAELLALSGDTGKRHAAYRALFDEALDERLQQSIRESTNGGYPLASEQFKARMVAPEGARIQRGKPGPKTEQPRAIYAARRRPWYHGIITTLTPN
jgi:putative transposase